MPNRDHDSRGRDPRDRDAQLERDSQGPMRASLGGETVEPRILLSATWLVDMITSPPPDVAGDWGTLGADRLTGTDGDEWQFGLAGDDVLVASGGTDQLWGGLGRDVVDFDAFTTGVTIDLSTGLADSGSGDSSTLIGIEGAYGSSHADVFAFASAAAGDEFTVVGNGGQDFLDLQKYDSSAATFENGALVIDLGGGESFRINYDEVERIQFGDVLAKVLTGDHVNTSFTGDGLYVFEDTAFAVSFTGGGDLDWQYDATTDTITVNGSAGATAGTELVIDDLGRSPITVSTITLSENLRAISSSVDVDNLDLNGFDVDTVTVGNGTGTIATLVTPTIDSDLSVNANVTTVTIAGDIDRAVTIGGNVGSIDAHTINGPLAISGDAGTLTADTINGDVTIKGDLGSATVTTFQTSATLRVDNPTGIVNLTFGGSDRSFDTGDEPFVYRAAVDAFNLVPIALAGSDQVVQEGDAVGLDGRGSTDPKTTGLTYRWTQVSGPAVTLIDGDTATPRFTAPEGLVNTTIEFELQVDDGEDVAVDRVVVTVQADNDAPIANAGTDRIVAEGNATALDGRGSIDPEAQGLTYSWRQISGPPVTLVNPTAAVTGFVAPEGLANSVAQFELTVSDGASASVDTVSVIMLADNDAPTANAGADQTVDEGDTIVLDGSGSTDPENGTLTYAWQQVSGPPVQIVAADQPLAQTDADGSSFTTFTRTADGRVHFIAPEGLSNTTATFQLIVDDGTTRSIDTVTITIRADDDAPTVDAGPNRQITAGEVVKLAADGRDPENQPLSYRWVQLSGPTVTLSDPTAESPTFQVPTGHKGEMVVFGVQASDGTSTSFDTVAMRIENSPPVVVAGSTGNAESGESVGLSAFAQDVDGDDLTYRWMQVGGPSVNLAGTDLPNATFQAPEVSGPTQLRFQIEVNDGQTTTVQFVTVDVEPEPEANSKTPGGPVATPVGVVSPGEPEPEPDPGAGSSGNAGTTANEGSPPTTGTTTTGSTTTSEPDDADPAADVLDPFDNGLLASPSDAADADADALRAADSDRASDDQTANDATADDDLAANATVDADAQTLADDAPILALAGSEVELESFFLAQDTAEPTQVTWTQLSGTAVDFASEGAQLRIQLPESFTAEELVFEVEMMIDGEIRVQEITVAVQPVDAEQRTNATPKLPERQLADLDNPTDSESRGVGKLWAALVAFTSAGPTRLPRG